MPGGELVLRIAELIEAPGPADRRALRRPHALYIGAESLRRMGLPNPIVALENGTMGWELAGLDAGARRQPLGAGSPTAAQPRGGRAAAKRVATEDGVRFVSPDDLRALARRAERERVPPRRPHARGVRAGHIAGAVWAPGGQAVQATDEYVAVRAATIVLACDGFAARRR